MARYGRKKYASGRKSKAIDDRTGFKVDYKDLRKEWNGLWVHKDEWEPKHPQLEPRSASDAEALEHPRPGSEQDLTKVRILSGVVAYGACGTSTGQGVGNTAGGTKPTGQAITSALGTAVGQSGATPTGVAITSALGTVGTGPGTTGQAITSTLGTVVGSASAHPSGVATTGAIGDEIPTGATPLGVGSNMALGSVVVDIGGWGNDTWGSAVWGDA